MTLAAARPETPGPLPRVSVVMPTYGHAAFIGRALESILAQTLRDWELLVVDDGSPDGTDRIVEPYLEDARIRYRRLERNEGLGVALNEGSDAARAPLLGYLPSDDVYHEEHLATLVALLEAHPEAVLAYSGVRHHYNRYSEAAPPGEPLQLVQVVHRRVGRRWVERRELVTDDLDRMFWSGLRAEGAFVGSGRVSCEWVDHPGQLHKVIREPLGGVNPYRSRYRVGHPLRFHTTVGNRSDEVESYRRFRARPDTPTAGDGLRILLVGELAYNPERILALEESGHRLYGLWTPEPHSINTVGPLPFGHVQDLPQVGWQEAVREVRPDVIYALLNWQAVPWAAHVLREDPGVPFVWHYKEGPFINLERGTWPDLVDLTLGADGLVHTSEEMRLWFESALPGLVDGRPTLVLDGDLPKADWFAGEPARRLSEEDGEVHTVVPGRPIGLHPPDIGELAANGIHLHFYGDFMQGQWRGWIENALALAPRHLHLHPNVDQEGWLAEFSRYDAGWLHVFRSRNGGEIRRADWDDLNLPARIGTFAAAGLPLIQYDNAGAAVAVQSLARRHGIGVFFRDMGDLAGQLRDGEAMERLRSRAWAERARFTFDHHAEALVAFFRRVIEARRAKEAGDVASSVKSGSGAADRT